MAEVFGNYVEGDFESEEYLSIGFSPSSVPLKKRWKNNGLSADFIADYFKNFFVNRKGEEEEELIENLRDAVKYISNELLENAMKFQDDRMPFTAKIVFSLHTDKLIFHVTNCVHPDQVAVFQQYIQDLLEKDTDELYMHAMRNNAQEHSNRSGLGLLSMVCDYSASLGWKFETSSQDSSMMTVTTVVSLEI